MTRTAIRKALRLRRESLTLTEQQTAALRLTQQLKVQTTIIKAKHCGIYLSFDHEIDLQPLVEYCWQQQITCYLPVLHPVHERQLWWLPFYEDTDLLQNRFGIPEPRFDPTLIKAIWELDVVLVPMVGFDAQGHRLGMGGGYYDATLALQHAHSTIMPSIIGCAHDCQQWDAPLPIAAWDVPLPTIATPSGILSFD